MNTSPPESVDAAAGHPIAARTWVLAAALGVAGLGAGLVLSISALRPGARAVLLVMMAGTSVVAGAIDARRRIIPNRLIYPVFVVLAGMIGGLAIGGGPVSAADAALGLLAYGGALLIAALIAPRAMGMGDVKLAALVGMVAGAVGWRYVAVAAVVAVVAAGMGGVVALAMGRGRKATIPFGPYIAIGAVVSALAAPAIARWYLHALGAPGS